MIAGEESPLGSLPFRITETRLMPSPEVKRAWVLAALEEFELRLVGYAVRLLGDDSSARDAVQHAFLRLCGESPEEHKRSLAPWLFAVVRNRAIDLLRERGRAGSLEDGCQCELPDSPEDDPAIAAERDDLLAMIRRLLDDLPAVQAEAVVLWSEGFSYAEMAGITGKNEGSLRVMVHRSLTWLKQHPAIEAVSEIGTRSVSEGSRPEGARHDSPGQRPGLRSATT
jgi:RNA polymerase sigma-70 factor (ECF subfamily)